MNSGLDKQHQGHSSSKSVRPLLTLMGKLLSKWQLGENHLHMASPTSILRFVNHPLFLLLLQVVNTTTLYQFRYLAAFRLSITLLLALFSFFNISSSPNELVLDTETRFLQGN